LVKMADMGYVSSGLFENDVKTNPDESTLHHPDYRNVPFEMWKQLTRYYTISPNVRDLLSLLISFLTDIDGVFTDNFRQFLFSWTMDWVTAPARLASASTFDVVDNIVNRLSPDCLLKYNMHDYLTPTSTHVRSLVCGAQELPICLSPHEAPDARYITHFDMSLAAPPNVLQKLNRRIQWWKKQLTMAA